MLYLRAYKNPIKGNIPPPYQSIAYQLSRNNVLYSRLEKSLLINRGVGRNFFRGPKVEKIEVLLLRQNERKFFKFLVQKYLHPFKKAYRNEFQFILTTCSIGAKKLKILHFLS